MQSSVASEIEWRLSLYRNILDYCREGKFSFGRFLALVPSRLRLSVGESAAKMRVPAALPRTLLNRWQQTLPVADSAPLMRPVVSNQEELRRAIRFAQVDGDIDPVGTALWFAKEGNKFAGDAGAIYLKAFGEVGTGEGGDETAYLVHLLLAESLRRAADTAASNLRARKVLGPILLQLALQGLLETGAVEDSNLSARLGFQFAVTVSPLSMGLSAAELLKSPVNAYRTTAGAVDLARKLLPEAVENVDLESIQKTLADRLMNDPAQKAALARDLFADVIRDLLLLIVLQHSRPDTEKSLTPGRRIASSGEMLLNYLNDPRKKIQFQGWADQQKAVASQPATVLGSLLAKGDQIMAGDMQQLGRHGDLSIRAKLAATGAITLVLDERVEKMKQDLMALLEFLPDGDQESAYRAGKCYRIDIGQEPLYRLAEIRHEAHLFVDLKDFTKRTASIKEAAMGDFLRRYFYTPIFELARKLQNGNEKALAISNIVGDAVGFRGEIVPMVSLALGIRQILKAAAEELDKGVSEFLGGESSLLEEIDLEIKSWRDRIAQLDASLAGVAPGTPQYEQFVAAKKEITDRLAMLASAREERIAESVGFGVEAGAYVAFGAAAEVVDLSQAALGLASPSINESAGYTSVTIAERLNEAARGTARSGILRAERDLRVSKARKERSSDRVALPFQVSIGKSYQMDVPVPAGDAVSAAISAGDVQSATEAVQFLSRWFHGEVQSQVKTRDGLPESLGRSAEFYNAGCALSGTAVEAYRHALEGKLAFQEFQLAKTDLPEDFLAKWVFEYEPERFQTVTRVQDQKVIYVLRYAGQAAFKGFEKEGGIDVWEIILADSAFCRDLLALLSNSPRVTRPKNAQVVG